MWQQESLFARNTPAGWCLRATVGLSKPKLTATILVIGLFAVSAGSGALPKESETSLDYRATSVAEQKSLPPEKEKLREAVDQFGDALPPGALARLGTIRFQHGGPPWALAFAPDGHALASAGYDGPVHIWETATGKELTRIEDERIPEGAGAVYGLAYSPDGKTIAGAQINHPPCLWDVATGKELRQFGGDKQRASWVVFSPDGKTLAYGGGWKDPTVWLAEVKTGKVLNQFGGHEGFVVPSAFSPDGKIIACADDISIHLIDAKANKEQELDLPDNHAIRYSSLAFSPDGKMLAASSKENKLIRLVEVATKKIVHDITLPTKSEQGVPILFTPDGKTLISGHSDGMVRFWNVKSGTKVREFRAYSQIIITLALSPDGRTLATASNSNAENGVRLWETATGKRLVPFPGPQQRISFLVFSPDSKLVATASSGVHVWEASNGKLLHEWDMFGPLAFTPDGKTLVCGGWRDGKVHFLDLATGKEARKFQAHDNIFCLAVAANGKNLATAGHDGFLRLWDLTNGHQLQDFGGKQKDYVSKVSFSTDARLLASIHQDDRVVRFWDTGTGKLFREQSETDFVDGVSFSPDGKLVAMICRDERNQKMFVRFREITTGNEVRLLPLGHGYRRDTVTYSPDGRTLIWAGPDRNLYLWEVATGQLRKKFSGHQGQVTCVAYSPNGRMMASGNANATALIWDVAGQRSRQNGDRLPPPSADQLEKLWADLISREGTNAYQSLCDLRAFPDQTIPFLERHLKPVPIADAKRVAEALRNLDNDKFTVRDQAAKELESLGEAAESPLRKALEGKPSEEVKRRAEGLLNRLEGDERLRQSRALEVLEHIANADARKLLKRLTEGDPEAWLTNDAQASLARLQNR
jgi:WD40 repeat protein